ncbi:MAG: hypothetical protein K0R82_2092 [Flavipsychrobacter sp.]|jgi:hypothetical protein|nr:hypothetical protein [Flavipsychrobacter sp.]
MKKTLVKLLSCCLLAVMASCANGGTTEEIATTDTSEISPEAKEKVVAPNGTTITCADCTQASLCDAESECADSILKCHYIHDTTFARMTRGYNGGGNVPQTVAQIQYVLDHYSCQDHRIIIVGNHASTSAIDTDIHFKLIKLTKKEKERTTPVSYSFPLFRKIIEVHQPTEIRFSKARKGNYNDIVITVMPGNGSPAIHYDLSDIPPAVGTYEEIPLPE